MNELTDCLLDVIEIFDCPASEGQRRALAKRLRAFREAEARRCVQFVEHELKGPDGCCIPNPKYVADAILKSAGLE